MQEHTPETPDIKKTMREEYSLMIETLKVDINNFLYAKMPRTMTLDEFDDFGCHIAASVDMQWQKRMV